MTDTIRALLISLSSHMAYMQGQLEARHELDDPEDFYWYRESVLLRQKVTDALADQPAVSEGREPTRDELWELWLRLNNEMPDRPAAVAEFWEHACVHARARWGNPAPAPLADGDVADEPAVPEGREPVAVTGQPSDEEVLRLAQQHSVVSLWSDGSACTPFQDGYDMRGELIAFARALLALCGTPAPAPPADGEVAELVKDLREQANHGYCEFISRDDLRRTAELLQRQALVPVPVSERLPGPGDCLPWPGEPDETHWCWAFIKGPLDDDSWERRPVTSLTTYKPMHSHWLPAHALPIPQQQETDNG